MAHLVSIDNGGTFTDICVIGDAGLIHSKVLTTPYDLTKCFLDVIVAASERLYGEADITRFIRETEYLRYSTTAGTNAMVERIGPVLRAVIKREVPGGLERLPSTVLGRAGGGEIATDPRDNQGTKAFEKMFQFDLELTRPLDRVFVGGRVYVRFDHDPEPLAFQWYRQLRQMFLRRFNV